MHPADELDRIASLLEQRNAGRYREQAFRRAADAVRDHPTDELRELLEHGALGTIRGVGEVTAEVIAQSLTKGRSDYLTRLEASAAPPDERVRRIAAQLVGDLHCHSTWSDGGAAIEQMARKALAIGHQYLALTDHSPRLAVARGLTTERLVEQLQVVHELNEELAPFRILTGIEVDILEDGSLDQTDDVLARLDVVVASVHSKLRMPAEPMTQRMLAAVANPHADILGHCTGRIVVGRGRPESAFDADAVFDTCVARDKAVEINCRPDRLDPPSRLLASVAQKGCKVAINTDAHAVGQLDWQRYGCERAAAAGIEPANVVNTWPLERLLQWTATHETTSEPGDGSRRPDDTAVSAGNAAGSAPASPPTDASR